jgi:hypothetical protein
MACGQLAQQNISGKKNDSGQKQQRDESDENERAHQSIPYAPEKTILQISSEVESQVEKNDDPKKKAQSSQRAWIPWVDNQRQYEANQSDPLPFSPDRFAGSIRQRKQE